MPLSFEGSQRLAVRTVTLPPIGPHDLLIRTTSTAISAPYPWPRLPGVAFPLIPGDAAVGTVVATGAAVDATWHSAPVFVGMARIPEGINAARGVQQAWLVASIDATVRIDGLEPSRALLIAPLSSALHNLGRVGVMAGARLDDTRPRCMWPTGCAGGPVAWRGAYCCGGHERVPFRPRGRRSDHAAPSAPPDRVRHESSGH